MPVFCSLAFLELQRLQHTCKASTVTETNSCIKKELVRRNFWNLAREAGFCMVKRNIDTVLLALIFVGSSSEMEKDVRYDA